MANRAQIEKLSRSVDEIASMLSPPPLCFVSIYDGETESEALSAYRSEFGIDPRPTHTVFNRACPGDTRKTCVASGKHGLFCLGPSDVRVLLTTIDGKTRSIPTACEF